MMPFQNKPWKRKQLFFSKNSIFKQVFRNQYPQCLAFYSLRYFKNIPRLLIGWMLSHLTKMNIMISFHKEVRYVNNYCSTVE